MKHLACLCSSLVVFSGCDRFFKRHPVTPAPPATAAASAKSTTQARTSQPAQAATAPQHTNPPATPEQAVVQACRELLGLPADANVQDRCFPIAAQGDDRGRPAFLALVDYSSESKPCSLESPTPGGRRQQHQERYLLEVRSSEERVIPALNVQGHESRVEKFDELIWKDKKRAFASEESKFEGLVFSQTSDCHEEEWGDRLEAVSDINGDGNPELFVSWYFSHGPDCDGMGKFGSAILTLQDGVLQPYDKAPTVHYRAEMVPSEAQGARMCEDLDHDGRPDLVETVGPYDGIQDGDYVAVPGVFAYHALSDGRFTMDDAVAQEPVRQWCEGYDKKINPFVGAGPALASLRADSTFADFARGLVCARLFRAKAEDVLARAQALCQQEWNREQAELRKDGEKSEKDVSYMFYDPATKGCRPWIAQLINTEPPFRFR